MKNTKGCHHTIPDLHAKFNSQVLTDPYDKAEAINQYFTSVYTKKDLASAKHCSKKKKHRDNHHHIHGRRIVQTTDCHRSEQVLWTRQHLWYSTQGRCSYLAVPLAKIFNTSLQLGCVPVDWKSANITQLFKNGSKHQPSNYRSISQTSLVVNLFTRHWICSKWNPHNHSWSKSYAKELKELHVGWQSISQKYKFLTLCLIYRIIHSLDCIQFRNFF